MKVNAQGIVTVLLAALVVVGPTASRAERLGGDPAPGALHPWLLEVNRTSCRKPPALNSTTPEFADYDAEEADDDDAPPVSVGEWLRPRDPGRPASQPRCPGPHAPIISAPLFLLLRHLVC